MSPKNDRPMTEEEFKKIMKTGIILIAGAFIFMGVMAVLVHTEAIKLYPSNTSVDMVKTSTGRLEFALRYQTLLLAWLMFNVLATIYGRLTTKAINPLDEKSESNVLAHKCILTNSFEQIVLSILAQLIYITFASPECILKVIPLVNIIQFVGRIGFFTGYPLKRAFGFHCTAFPTILLVIYNVYSFVGFLVK